MLVWSSHSSAIHTSGDEDSRSSAWANTGVDLGCEEEVGASVVLCSAIAVMTEQMCMAHTFRVAVITTASAESLSGFGQSRPLHPRQVPGGCWGKDSPGQCCGSGRADRDAEGEENHIATIFACDRSPFSHVAWFLEPGSSCDKFVPFQQCGHLRK